MRIVLPELYGLILSGGKSSRMGQDKALLKYHGEPHGRYCQRLLSEFCAQVFLSCRVEQLENPVFRETFSEMPVISDTYGNIGPMAGLLSAMENHPQVAWLVLACDMPNVNQELMRRLLVQRDPKRLATVFKFRDPSSRVIFEPLFALYEPSFLLLLQQRFQEKRFSLRGCLESADANQQIHSVELNSQDANLLLSLNTPQEAEHFLHRDMSGFHVP